MNINNILDSISAEFSPPVRYNYPIQHIQGMISNYFRNADCFITTFTVVDTLKLEINRYDPIKIGATSDGGFTYDLPVSIEQTLQEISQNHILHIKDIHQVIYRVSQKMDTLIRGIEVIREKNAYDNSETFIVKCVKEPERETISFQVRMGMPNDRFEKILLNNLFDNNQPMQSLSP